MVQWVLIQSWAHVTVCTEFCVFLWVQWLRKIAPGFECVCMCVFWLYFSTNSFYTFLYSSRSMMQLCCFHFTHRNMGDVQLVTSSPMSKTRLTLGKVSVRDEAPTFTLPPRNTRVSQGGTARLEGKVQLYLATHFRFLALSSIIQLILISIYLWSAMSAKE